MTLRFRIILAAVLATALSFPSALFAQPGKAFPDSVIIKTFSREHVQGMAVDTLSRCYYMSFTTSFKKVDMEGNVIASVDSLNGHLGAMVFDPVSRRVYASLEYKDDEIGKLIARNLGVSAHSREDIGFNIAVFNVDEMTAPGTPAQKVMETFRVEEAAKDYKVRYGCSGIDGMALAPRIGRKGGKPCLYVSYGVYNDVDRNDNDHQIILRYSLRNLAKPKAKYFVYTGNTYYGVQNMAYDPLTGNLFLACYKGRKPQFPNHTLFAVPVLQKPVKKVLKGLENDGAHLLLQLDGQKEGFIPGWDFPKASTGFCTVGGGVWFNSSPVKTKAKGGQTCIVRKLIWTGDHPNPFRKP